MPKSTKPWYTRRRYWSLAILAVLVYFCLIPSPLRVSPQTTGIASPLLPNGEVDYFGAYEQTYIHKLSPPEDNGQRLLIAACGPRILEQAFMIDTVPWEQLPTDERSKQWFEEKWIPLCEHMYIDPYAKPKFLDSLEYYSFMKKDWETNNQVSYDHKQGRELHLKLIAAPWTAEEHPDIARWLEERSPVLDLFGIAVRKPNFACYRWREDSLFSILLPDVQANRSFVRELQIRVTERLGRGDIDGAWHDVMSMFCLSRKHYLHDTILVVNLIGLAVEAAGWESAQVILQHENLTSEQLEQFAQDLDSLPRKSTQYPADIERLVAYSVLQEGLDSYLAPSGVALITDDGSGAPASWGGLGWLISRLPYDRNIAGRRLTEIYNVDRLTFGDSHRAVLKKDIDERLKVADERRQQLRSPWTLLRVPLIRTRSQLIADCLTDISVKSIWIAENAVVGADTRLVLFRLAVALERHKLAMGEYPSDLEALVPQFLEEVPLDPFTGRKTFVYKPAPDEETAFLLHSSEWDESDKGSPRANLFIRLAVRRSGSDFNTIL